MENETTKKEVKKCEVCSKNEPPDGCTICNECYESYKLLTEGPKIEWHKVNLDQLR